MAADMLHIREGDDVFIDDNMVLPYRLVKNLGHGHSANVEMVEDMQTKAVYARKVFRIRNSRDERRRIFENEIKIIRRLSHHHHVIQVFATYVAKREVGLILSPVADGGDLDAFLHDCKEMDELLPEQASILKSAFGCLARGLHFMHHENIRHKDIKPRNILIHQGTVIYTDFGYSLDYSFTMQSTTTGRPYAFTQKYCAPEVRDWEPRNSKSDIFSLGCVFLEILAALHKRLVLPSSGAYHQHFEHIGSILADFDEALTKTTKGPFEDHLISRLIKIMLQPSPRARPSAETTSIYLWKFMVGPYLCSKCESERESILQEIDRLKASGNDHSEQLEANASTALQVLGSVNSTPMALTSQLLSSPSGRKHSKPRRKSKPLSSSPGPKRLEPLKPILLSSTSDLKHSETPKSKPPPPLPSRRRPEPPKSNLLSLLYGTERKEPPKSNLMSLLRDTEPGEPPKSNLRSLLDESN